MDSEKKPKRPRIGALNTAMDSMDSENRYRTPQSDNSETPAGSQEGSAYQRPETPYQPYQRREGGYQPYQRPNNGYQPRQNNGYQPRQNGYQQNGYQRQNNGYQPRQNNYNQQNNDMQGGYQPRQNNGYQPRQNNGYQPRQNNGYQQRPGNGYQPRQNNGYQPRQNNGYQPRQNNGYQPRQNNGYQQRPGNGYQPRQNNGFRPGPQRNGYQQRPGNGYNQNRQQGGYNRNNQNNPQGRMFTPRPKQIDYIIDDIDPNAEIRLNKFMANAGICSRREADEYIAAGKVKVNGEVVTELGVKITGSDIVEYDDKVVTPERKCYVLLNKPKDCVTTSDDPNGRLTVLDLVKNACKERIYPVGRLDRNTTGVLLLTNDGDLASKLTHPKFVKKKIYHVWTDKDISEEDMQRIADGIELEDGEIHADAISYVSETDRNQAGIEIHSGRNRIVRRIFEHLGYRVTKLDRVYFAGLTKKNLPRGRWRYLTQEEVNFLRMGSFE